MQSSKLQPEERGVCESSSPADTKASEAGRAGDAPCPGAEIPPWAAMKATVRQGCPPAAQGGPWRSRDLLVDTPMAEQAET